MEKSPIVFTDADRSIIDTSKPNVNMMHDATRPFAVVEAVSSRVVGRVTCKGRYETLAKAKRALKYLI